MEKFVSATQKYSNNPLQKGRDTTFIDPLVALANSERTNQEVESEAQFTNKTNANIDLALETFQKHLTKGTDFLKNLQIWPQNRVEKRFLFFLDHRQETEEELKKGVSWQQLLHITDYEILLFYQESVKQYQRNQLDEAENLLFLLTHLNPLVSSFWVALGRVQEKKQDFEAAVYSHILGAELGEEHFVSYLHAAQCLLRLHHNDQVILLLEHVKERSKENAQFQTWAVPIETLLKQARTQ